MKNIALKLGTLGLLAATIVAPMSANASISREAAHRQDTKNTWRNVAIGSAALGVLGATQHDNVLTAIGAIGAVYSGIRYEQDRGSDSRACDIARRRNDSRNDNRNDHRNDRRDDRGFVPRARR